MNNASNTSAKAPANLITEIMNRIYSRRMTTTSGGNISIKDTSGNTWITPAGVDKGELQPSDIVCMQPDGTVTGSHMPSSEYPFHKAIYDCRPDIKAIVHAHPPALVSWSITDKIPDPLAIFTTQRVCGSVGFAPYAIPGSQALGEKVAREFSKGHNIIMMENHGAVAGGADIAEAYQRFESLENCADAIIGANILGKPTCLSQGEYSAFYNTLKYAFPQTEPSGIDNSDENRRIEILKFVQRGCRLGLMASAAGTVSMRCDENDFLITPVNISRWSLQAGDIVKISGGKCEAGKTPGRSARLHQAIYENHPDVHSIILAQPPNLMAFGISGTPFDVHTIPESLMFLKEVVLVPFMTDFGKLTEFIVNQCSVSNAMILMNNTVLTTGNSVLQAFDRLEIAEFGARSLIMSKAIGKFKPINSQQADEIRRMFP
jgi:L-fuculose-phosphate aldolase